ncbi:hypothetical protein H0H81_000249, partial [Sphagnurus paluster]
GLEVIHRVPILVSSKTEDDLGVGEKEEGGAHEEGMDHVRGEGRHGKGVFCFSQRRGRGKGKTGEDMGQQGSKDVAGGKDGEEGEGQGSEGKVGNLGGGPVVQEADIPVGGLGVGVDGGRGAVVPLGNGGSGRMAEEAVCMVVVEDKGGHVEFTRAALSQRWLVLGGWEIEALTSCFDMPVELLCATLS